MSRNCKIAARPIANCPKLEKEKGRPRPPHVFIVVQALPELPDICHPPSSLAGKLVQH